MEFGGGGGGDEMSQLRLINKYETYLKYLMILFPQSQAGLQQLMADMSGRHGKIPWPEENNNEIIFWLNAWLILFNWQKKKITSKARQQLKITTPEFGAPAGKLLADERGNPTFEDGLSTGGLK